MTTIRICEGVAVDDGCGYRIFGQQRSGVGVRMREGMERMEREYSKKMNLSLSNKNNSK